MVKKKEIPNLRCIYKVEGITPRTGGEKIHARYR